MAHNEQTVSFLADFSHCCGGSDNCVRYSPEKKPHRYCFEFWERQKILARCVFSFRRKWENIEKLPSDRKDTKYKLFFSFGVLCPIYFIAGIVVFGTLVVGKKQIGRQWDELTRPSGAVWRKFFDRLTGFWNRGAHWCITFLWIDLGSTSFSL
jgi:hypothetical protein